MGDLNPRPDRAGRLRPNYPPPCCKGGIWVIDPRNGVWCCSECVVYGPLRERGRDWTITLTSQQFERARAVGRGRHERAMARSARNEYGASDSLPQHQEACCAELACSLLTDRPWDDSQIPSKDPDVGELHVRSTRHENGHLLFHAEGPGGEPPGGKFDLPGPYVLMLGAADRWLAAGWRVLPDHPVSVWREWRPGRPSWGVPQRALHPMGTLPPWGGA